MAASAERSATITIRGPLRREDLRGLFVRTCRLLSEQRCEVLLCEVAEISPDAVALDALARLALAARRQGCAVRVRGACEQMRMLVALAGLGEVIRVEEAERRFDGGLDGALAYPGAALAHSLRAHTLPARQCACGPIPATARAAGALRTAGRSSR
jgi:ABC-type transporter Mla MlaB component